MHKIKNFVKTNILLLISIYPILSYAQDIYWLDSNFDAPRLVKMDSSGNELSSKTLPSASLPQAITLDRQNNSIFWTSLAFINAGINKISSDLTQTSVIIDGQSVLRGMAIDPGSQKIYWISTNLIEGPKIWRADLNGMSPEILLEFGAASNSTPRSIVLDSNNSKMYWTNFGEGKIQRADMSSAAVAEDIVSGLDGPSGLDIDAVAGKIFWTEMNSHQIKSADLDGNNMVLLLDSLSYPNSISVNHILNKMVWTETGSGKIRSARLDGSGLSDYNISAKAPTGILIEPVIPLSIRGDLRIIPQDTTIQIHNFIQYRAQIIDSNHVSYPTRANWYVKRKQVGVITNDGLLFSYFPGYAHIMAKKDSMVAKAKLMVIDSTTDSSGVNKIKIIRNFKHGHGRKYKIFKEGETYTIAGLPFPYNIINGTMIYFPRGSLHEDISIEIELPECHKIRSDSIDFANRIINGIRFNVFSGDSLIEPFYFKKPVSLSIPYKRGLLKKYGIDPLRLSLFYAIDSTTFDSLGIHHVMVDTCNNRIFGLVEHFSSLVVREKEKTNPVTGERIKNDLPDNFELKQNYPNPFNPSTTITYQLPAEANHGSPVHVNLSVYNMLGQKIATLVNKKQEAGNYSVNWDATGFASGVYLYILKAGNNYKQTRKLVLIR